MKETVNDPLRQAVREIFGAYVSEGKVLAFALALDKRGLAIVAKKTLAPPSGNVV